MTDPKFLVYLGNRIKVLRLERNISQASLAIECEFDKASMSRIESGKSNITILNLRKICRALNVELADFFNASESTANTAASSKN